MTSLSKSEETLKTGCKIWSRGQRLSTSASSPVHLLEYDGGSIALDGEDAPDEEDKLEDGAGGRESDLLQQHLGEEHEGQHQPVAEGGQRVRAFSKVIRFSYQ